jgi:hypothetical protein
VPSGQAGANQGAHPRQGGTPVSGHQTPVWLRQGQVPGAGQEHGQPDDAVCAVQPVDGAQTTFEHGGTGMSAPENGQRAVNGDKNALETTPSNAKECRDLKNQATTTVSAGVVQTFPSVIFSFQKGHDRSPT